MSISLLLGFLCFLLSGLACSQLPQTKRPVTSSPRGFGSGIPMSCPVLASLLPSWQAGHFPRLFPTIFYFITGTFHNSCHPIRGQITGNYFGIRRKMVEGLLFYFTKARGEKKAQPEKGFPSYFTCENIHCDAQLCPFLCRILFFLYLQRLGHRYCQVSPQGAAFPEITSVCFGHADFDQQPEVMNKRQGRTSLVLIAMLLHCSESNACCNWDIKLFSGWLLARKEVLESAGNT